MEERKIKVVGYPGKDGNLEYVALDAATGAYLEGQTDVVIQTNPETGSKNAQIVLYCCDIVLIQHQRGNEGNGLTSRECRACTGGNGEGICDYHANMFRRSGQRYDHISRNHPRH